MTDSKFEGQVLGGYHFIKLLGRGGFGDVYLAEHTVIKNLCAIKALRIYEEKDIELVRAEAQILGKLDHDHIIKILYFFVAEQTPFLVMEYAPNGSLRDLHPHGTRLSPSIILNYMKQVVSALQYLHNEDNKLVHCDIKPENLLLSKRNKVLLNDFGLTKITGSAHYDLERFGGDVRYMAPEQIKGYPQRASDQYSLAMTVYEWLCGTLPFPGGNFIQISYQHISTEPEPLRTYIPSIPPKVEEVVLKALSNAPKDRYPDIMAFAHALENAIKLPFEEYYLAAGVAAVMRDCYYKYVAVADWGEMREITREDAKLRVSHRGTEGYLYPFTRGGIYWSKRGGAQPLWGAFSEIHRAWERDDGDYLGFPLTSELPASNLPGKTEGVFQRFEGPWDDYPEDVNTNPTRCGASLYCSVHGAHLTWGSIGLCYERLYGTTSKLGFPKSEEEDVEALRHNTKGKRQTFEGGRIYWIDGAGDSYPTWGAIGWQYNKLHSTNGRLGFPLSAEIDIVSPTNNKRLGKYQRFQGGTIYWKNSPPYDDTYPIWGAIGRFYEQSGGVNGFLGFPTSAEKHYEGDHWHQSFENGDIYWSKDGGHDGIVVQGSILQTYKHFGGLEGKFGVPKSPETAVEGHPELRVQEFDGGVICVVKETQ